jgi:hypothetical protein
LAYLGATITGQSVIPQSFVRPLDWDLMLMIAMSKRSGSQEGNSQDVGQHGEVESNRAAKEGRKGRK